MTMGERQSNYKIMALRMDNGGEYVNREVKKTLGQKVIRHRHQLYRVHGNKMELPKDKIELLLKRPGACYTTLNWIRVRKGCQKYNV